jgi:archaeosine synthase beta-subunit
MTDLDSYPAEAAGRDVWIRSRRSGRPLLDAWKPYAWLLEEERSASGEMISVVTLFLTNRECPWRCLMCDLWKHTLTESVPIGAIPAQIDYGLDQLQLAAGDETGKPDGIAERPDSRSRVPRQVKLYNSGSFFDPGAIPPSDYRPIAQRVGRFERVIVECHPSLVNEKILSFRDLLREEGGARLEVAVGLETAHPGVLGKLNKRMTLDLFRRAADFLGNHQIDLRVFILVKPPFLNEEEGLDWAGRSLNFAFDCGACVASLIPTRPGNGAMDALAARGDFAPPKLETVEAAHAYGLRAKRGRVLADLWDLERFSNCPACFAARRNRLAQMNARQEWLPDIPCAQCGTADTLRI